MSQNGILFGMSFSNIAKIWLISPALILVEGWALHPLAPVGFIAAISYLVCGVPLGGILVRRLNLWTRDWLLDPPVIGATALFSGLAAVVALALARLNGGSGGGAHLDLWLVWLVTTPVAGLLTALAMFLADLVLRPAPPPKDPPGDKG
jgi:hypothetical protein